MDECSLNVKGVGPNQMGTFEPLASEDVYAYYFNQLCLPFGKLVEFYTGKVLHSQRPSYETETITSFLQKMLHTIKALRLKYTHNPLQSMKVDLSESGFPSFLDIENITADLCHRDDYLANSQPLATLKQRLLDHMFENQEESDTLLWATSERAYYEMLDYQKLMLTFIPGVLELVRTNDTHRSYAISWACYDFETNRPYIWIMVFDQDIGSEPLENRADNFRKFLEVIRAEGSRAPTINIVAMAIDHTLEDIHPKEIKRIGIGPLCTMNFSKDPQEIYELLMEHGESDHDYVLFFDEEIIISTSQRVTKGMLQMGKERVREIFSIPQTEDCHKRQASVVHRYMLLPHYALQNMNPELRHAYRRHIMVPYDMEGGIYECTITPEN